MSVFTTLYIFHRFFELVKQMCQLEIFHRNNSYLTAWFVLKENLMLNWTNDTKNQCSLNSWCQGIPKSNGVSWSKIYCDIDCTWELPKKTILLFQDELRGATLLVFANKQDLPNAMRVSEITDKLGLHSLRQRNWYIFSFRL